jgi:hypothetical protein
MLRFAIAADANSWRTTAMMTVVSISMVLTFMCCAWGMAAASQATREAIIGDKAFHITIPRHWAIQLQTGWEFETYVVSDHKTRLFFIYRGNNPALSAISKGKKARKINISSNRGTAYLSNGTVTDIVLTPHCGPDRYVWLGSITRSPRYISKVRRAISSFGCVTQGGREAMQERKQ